MKCFYKQYSIFVNVFKMVSNYVVICNLFLSDKNLTPRLCLPIIVIHFQVEEINKIVKLKIVNPSVFVFLRIINDVILRIQLSIVPILQNILYH